MIVDLEGTMTKTNTPVEQLKAHRATCDAQINAMLNSLEVEQARLSLSIDQRKAILSPARRLPFEFLQHIFMDTIDFPPHAFKQLKDSREWYDLPEEDTTLWALELVCKTWRAGLLADSSLWSFIDIIVSRPNFDKRSPHYVTRLATRLERARLFPISLSIRRCASFSFNELPQEISLLLIPYANRICELHLLIPHPMLSELSLLRNRFTNLNIINTPFIETSENSIDLFTHCPRLKTVWTTDVASPGFLFSLPWQNAEVIASDHAYMKSQGQFPVATRPSDWRILLTKAINLRECHLDLELSDKPTTAPSNYPLTCHYLVSLVIVCHFDPVDNHPLPQLLGQLTLPSLTKLEILSHADSSLCIIEGSDISTSVVDLIERSRCPLATLEFHEGDILPNDLVRFFARHRP